MITLLLSYHARLIRRLGAKTDRRKHSTFRSDQMPLKTPKFPKARLPKMPRAPRPPKAPAATKARNRLRCTMCGQTFIRVGMDVGPHKDRNGLICMGVVVFEGIVL